MGISTKHKLYNFVADLRKELGITLSNYPVDAIDICGNLPNTELRQRKFNTNGLCGAIMMGNKSDVIILNSNRNAGEMNFDCAHEITHKFKHRGKGIDSFSCVNLKTQRDPSVSFFEWEANEGGAELLVPFCLLLPRIASYWPFKSWQDIVAMKEDLSYEFGVSPAVIHYRCESLRYEIHQYLSGLPLSAVEVISNTEQKNRRIKVKSIDDIENEMLEKEWQDDLPTPSDAPPERIARKEPLAAESQVVRHAHSSKEPLKMSPELQASFAKAEEQWLYGF